MVCGLGRGGGCLQPRTRDASVVWCRGLISALFALFCRLFAVVWSVVFAVAVGCRLVGCRGLVWFVAVAVGCRSAVVCFGLVGCRLFWLGCWLVGCWLSACCFFAFLIVFFALSVGCLLVAVLVVCWLSIVAGCRSL